MSTRCQIGFYDNPKQKNLRKFTALVYRHSDGYPGKEDGSDYGVLTDIVPFLKWFNKERGLSDTEYAAARCLQHLCNTYDTQVTKDSKQFFGTPNTDDAGLLGHGICRGFHGDIEYFYAVYPDRLEVYDTPFDAEPDKWKLIETIKL